MSAETKSPEDYKKSLENDELNKLTNQLSKLQVSNEKPLMTTYPVQSNTKPGKTSKGKSAKARTINIQAATRRQANEKMKSERQSKQTMKRATMVSISNILPTVPEGTRSTRAQTRKILEKLPLTQKKGAKARTKKILKTLEQRARERRQATISSRRTGIMRTLQAQKKEERSRKAKEAAVKAAASKAEKESKKQSAIEKAKATKAAKKDTTME